MAESVRCCETCVFWYCASRKVSNSGDCGYLLEGDTPFWANQLKRQTISWEGRDCVTWRGGRRAS